MSDEAIVSGVGVEIYPVAEDFSRRLRDAILPDADRVGSEAGRVIQERINSSLSSIEIHIDTMSAHADLDDLAARLDELGSRDTRHDIDLETEGAHLRLDELQARLDELGATETRHRVVIDTDRSGSGGGLGGIDFGGGLLAAGIGLSPALIPVLASAVPLVEGIGAAAVGAGAGLGTMALSFKGVGSAVEALDKQSSLTGQQLAQQAAQQLSAADSILNAQDSVKNAVTAVADAQRSAALSVQNAEQSVRTAEQQLTDAQYNAAQAQISLTNARKQAAQTLQDLNNQVKDGALAQRQAVLDLQAAQQNLTVVDFNPHSTDTQRAQAQLAVDQAKQHLAELQQANQRTAEAKAQADAQGVSNAPTVLSAEHALEQATRSRTDAEQNLVKARASVAEAERAGAEQIAKADQQVIQSQRSLQLAYAEAGAQGTSANNDVAKAMAGLTPAGQAFAEFIHSKIVPAWHEIQGSAQTGFLPGLQAALTILLPYLPSVAKFIGDIGRETGNLVVQAAKAFTSPFWLQFFGFLGDLAKSSLAELVPILINLATGFAGLFQALMPAAGGLGGGLEKITAAFANWATHLGTNQGFQHFLDYVRQNAPGVGRFFADLAVTVGKLLVAFAPLGALIAASLEKLFSWLSSLSPGQLIGIAAAIGAIGLAIMTFTGGPVTLIVAAITAIVGGLVYAYTHFQTFHNIVDAVWHAIAVGATWLWNQVLKPTFDFIVDHWHYVATAFKLYWDYYAYPIFQAFAAIATWLWKNIVVPSFDGMKEEWRLLAVGFGTIYNDVLKPLWSAFTKGISTVRTAFGSFKAAMSSIWSDIKTIFTDGYNFVTQKVLNKFIDALNGIGHTILGLPVIPDIQPLTGAAAAPGASGTAGSNSGNAERYAFASGGVVPGYAPGHDLVHALLSPGEGVLVPEAVRALGEDTIHAINKSFTNRVSTPNHFLGGGVARAIVQGGADAALGAAEAPFKAIINSLRPEVVKMLAQDGFGLIDKGIRGFAARTAASVGAGINIGSLAHTTLIKAALKLAGVADTIPNESDVNIIVTNESGWNPNAINLTDSNAIAGHPSQGLMQTIPSTFEAYRLPSLPDNIVDPLANMVAGIRYAIARYGSLDDVPGVAAVHAGGKYVGYDSGGYLPPGITQVYNGTGRPEVVFTDQQWNTLRAAGASRAVAGGGSKIAEEVHFHGSRDEMLTELQRRQTMQNLMSGV